LHQYSSLFQIFCIPLLPDHPQSTKSLSSHHSHKQTMHVPKQLSHETEAKLSTITCLECTQITRMMTEEE
jgi:hypothetical protein